MTTAGLSSIADQIGFGRARCSRIVDHGRSNAEIAERLHMSVATVKANITRIFAKPDADNRVQVAMKVRDAGLLCARPRTRHARMCAVGPGRWGVAEKRGPPTAPIYLRAPWPRG
ncbi:LuxR C-terminal-related transcriptional regulator [Microbispora amethystogenes]|uniref:response regulator transcription factor n=1 Tax=Microbispora amethystogenes TaxID=1427754 RepID=UPI00341055AA